MKCLCFPVGGKRPGDLFSSLWALIPWFSSSQGQDSAYFLAAFLHSWEHSTPSCHSTVLWTQQKPLLDGEGFKKLTGAECVDPATGHSLQLAGL